VLLLLKFLIFVFFFFFLLFLLSQSAEPLIIAGTDTCCDAEAVHPRPLNFAEAKLFFFLLLLLVAGVVSFVVVVEEKVDRRKEEMVDLQRVDWIMEGICGFGLGGSVSEMGWWNWLLGLLHFFCSPIDEASAARTGMISILSTREQERERERVCFSCLWMVLREFKEGIMDYGMWEVSV